MKPLIFTLESDEKIHLTREELEKLLTDAYEDGRENGKRVEYVPYYPSTVYPPTIVPSVWYDTPTAPPYTITYSASTLKEVVK